MTHTDREHADVVVVGAGPAGLAAAIELRRLGVPRVLVLEREPAAGGIPRHSCHTGFGLRDLHRLLSGPRYAARYVELAQRAGVDLRVATTVTGWERATTPIVTSANGITAISAQAVVLATGCRERPRAARLIPGDRPLGVLTTGALQQLVYLRRQPAGRRAVVVGAEHVSFSAVLTLAHAGADTVAMVTEHPRHQTYVPYKWLSATRLRVPVLTAHRLTRIIGVRRVEAAEVVDLRTAVVHQIPCDTVVCTGDFIPDHELARAAGLSMNAGTRGPATDGALRTSVRAVFAAGNLVHPAETADIAALSGRHCARAVHAFLLSERWPERTSLPIVGTPPVQWVAPNAIDAERSPPPHNRFTWRVRTCCKAAELLVRQGARVLWRQHYRRVVANLPLYASAAWISEIDFSAEPITFAVE